jgi:hypothetical protein
MSVLDFIAALVAALAWPIALVVVVLILRSHIPDFLRSLRRLKLSGFELEMERTSAIAETAVAVAADTAGAEMDISGGAPPAVLVPGDSAATILRAYGRLEDELRRRLKEGGLKGLEGKSANELVSLGTANGVFIEETAEAVRGASVLRNLAAHRRAEHVGPDEVAQYLAIIEATLYALGAKPKKK